jgi:hypothetical protein
MTAHHFRPVIRARNLSNVLDDLREARGDVDAARMAVLNGEDAEDRVTEAETREEDLREEFAAKFVEANGMTIEDFRTAFAKALI